jgi:putative transposase
MLGSLFDRDGERLVDRHNLPHWAQTGVITFITFRTKDSIPARVLKRWEQEKQEWLRVRGIQTTAHWSKVLPKLDPSVRSAFFREFNRTREEYLDTCQGRCLLRNPELAMIVAESLQHFDSDRYRMGDFVVMPNHVHVLCAFERPEQMRAQLDSWLHYTAFRINRAIKEKGSFWQEEPFDHLVRTLEQYEYLRKYIADNPAKAGLRPGEYVYHRFDG